MLDNQWGFLLWLEEKPQQARKRARTKNWFHARKTERRNNDKNGNETMLNMNRAP